MRGVLVLRGTQLFLLEPLVVEGLASRHLFIFFSIERSSDEKRKDNETSILAGIGGLGWGKWDQEFMNEEIPKDYWVICGSGDTA